MADTKISALTALTAAAAATGDYFPIIDISEADADKNKRMTLEEGRKHLLTPRAALVKLSANITNPTYPYVVAWDAEEYDTDAMHDNATNNSRLTVPSGWSWVRVGAVINWGSLSTGTDLSMTANIRKNQTGTGFSGTIGAPYANSVVDGAGNAAVNITSAPLSVSAGDWFDVRLNGNATATASDIIKNDVSCFWMELLG